MRAISTMCSDVKMIFPFAPARVCESVAGGALAQPSFSGLHEGRCLGRLEELKIHLELARHVVSFRSSRFARKSDVARHAGQQF